jgi:biopolymer transport protein ExbD
MAGASSEDNPVAINVVAMVDIIFCLCLFFMCSLKFKPLDGKFDSWLPKTGGIEKTDAPAPIDPARIILSWDTATNSLQRIFGQGRPIPSGPEGDRLLADLLEAQRAGDQRLGRAPSPVLIDSGPAVPWTFVVEVMDIARDAGCDRIEFGYGTAFK